MCALLLAAVSIPVSAQTSTDCSDKTVENGCGTFLWPNGTKYVGGFRGGYPKGANTIYFTDGSKLLEVGMPYDDTDAKYSYIMPDGTEIAGALQGPAKDIHQPRPPMHFPFWRGLLGGQGSVEVIAIVEPDGSVTNAAVYLSSGSKSFDEAAVEGVLQWRYLPATIAGKPIRFPTIMHIDFAQPS